MTSAQPQPRQPTRSRPLVLATLTAAASLALLALAVRFGWLGPDVDRGAEFCEAAAGRVRQPVNTLSNLGFVVAGLAIARRADRLPVAGTALACLVVLLGPASMAMHATESSLGGHLDMLSMYLVASFAVAYAAMRLARRGPAFLAVVLVVSLLGCGVVEVAGGEVPVVRHAGNLAFGALLVTALVLERRIVRRGETVLDRRWILAAVGSLLGGLRDLEHRPGRLAAVLAGLALPGPRRVAPALRPLRVVPVPVLRQRTARAR